MKTKSEKKIILFGAGMLGERALWLYGARNVYCYADNIKHGGTFCGKDIISFDELSRIHHDYNVIISVNSALSVQISEKLERAGIVFGMYLEDLTDYQMSMIEIARLEKFKNAYDGQKVFLIGNGPSLTAQDLQIIQAHGIKTFACNLIHKIFEKTNWRPDFYCCYENSALVLSKDFIQHTPITAKFIRYTEDLKLLNIFNDEPMPDDMYYFVTGNMKKAFSPNVERVMYGGSTVMFTMLQFAVYMGFKEIYLLGVENTQPPTVHTKNFLEQGAHFYKEDKEELEKRKKILAPVPIDNNWSLYQENTTNNYKLAKSYADEHGINIYNATRGGKLEVFERVDFDTLF